MRALDRVYVIEKGGPVANYARAECDLLSFTNVDEPSAFWRGCIAAAKSGDFVQT